MPRFRLTRSAVALTTLALLLSLLTLPGQTVSAQDADEKEAAAVRDYRVAYGLQKKKLYEQAATRWQNFIKVNATHRLQPNANYHLGVCKFQAGKLPEAAAAYRVVLAKFPKFPSRDGAQFNLSLVVFKMAEVAPTPANYKLAATEFGKVSATYAQSQYVPSALYYQAESLYLAGDKAAAVPVYQSVVQKFAKSPLLPGVFYALGTCLQDLEKPAEAATAYAEYLKQFPTGPQMAECRLRLGVTLFDQKKFPEAQKEFTTAAAIPEFAFADYALLQQAQCLFEQEKLPEAAAIYESLPTKFKESQYVAPARLAAGKCWFRVKDFAKASTALQPVTADKTLPEAPEASYWLGRSLISLKKPQEAVTLLTQSASNYATSPFLPQIELARIDAIFEIPEQRGTTPTLYSAFAAKFPQHELAPGAQYRACFAAHNVVDYKAAIVHGEKFLANAAFAKHATRPDVLFLAGESYLLGETPDYAKADASYRRLITEHADSTYVPQARLRTGYCLYTLAKFDESVAWLTQSVAALTEPDQKAEAWLLIGRSHSDQKRHPEATKSFQTSVQSNPKWARADEVVYALAVSLLAQEQTAPAKVELQKLVTTFPESTLKARGHFHLGDIATAAKQYDPAILAYRESLKLNPEEMLASAAQYGIASAAFEKPDYVLAVAEASALLTKYATAETAPGALYLRGLSHQRTDKFAEAVKDLTTYVTANAKAANIADALFALALSQIGAEQHAAGVVTLNKLIAENAAYEQIDQALYELAFAHQVLKKPDDAAAAFTKLATTKADSPLAPEAWFRVGEYHEGKEEPDKAEAAFAAGLKIAKEPELGERLSYKLGWALYEQEKWVPAATALQAHVTKFAKGTLIADASFLAGECYHKAGDFTKAMPHYKRVIDLKSERYVARALYRSGDSAAALKNWPVSGTFYDTLIKQFPKFEQVDEARYGHAWALQNQNQLDPALVVLATIPKGRNTETAAKACFMMGECKFAQKKYGDAVVHFVEVVEGYSFKEWQALSLFELGRCFVELDEKDQARETLAQLVKEHPTHARAKDATALLASLK